MALCGGTGPGRRGAAALLLRPKLAGPGRSDGEQLRGCLRWETGRGVTGGGGSGGRLSGLGGPGLQAAAGEGG